MIGFERPKLMVLSICSLIPGLHIIVYWYILRLSSQLLLQMYPKARTITPLQWVLNIFVVGWGIQRQIMKETRTGGALLDVHFPLYIPWGFHAFFWGCVVMMLGDFGAEVSFAFFWVFQLISLISVWTLLKPFATIYDAYSNAFDE